MRALALAGLVAVMACGGARAPAPESLPPPTAARAPLPDAAAPTCCTLDDMKADLAKLQELLESSHPDPYERSGGPAAFRARFAEVERSLPPEGLDRTAFYARLRPLAAQIRDGHTYVWRPRIEHDEPVAIDLELVEERLVVAGVYEPEARWAIGAVVTGVEGVPVSTLTPRMAERRGYDNLYSNLTHLTAAVTSSWSLGDLVGHPVGTRATFDLRLADASTRRLDVPVAPSASAKALTAASKVVIPETDATGIGSGFGASDGRTAILRIDSAMRYREAFEVWRATGFASNLGKYLDEVFRDVTGALPPPTMSVDEKIRSIPSFTERLSSLVAEMKAKKTTQIVVDLRRNEGGNSAFALILAWFLYPLDALLTADEGYQVPRYSALYFANHTGDSLEKVRGRTRPSFALGDHDTGAEEAWKKSHGKPLSAEERERRRKELASDVGLMPSFRAVFEKRGSDAAWKPKVVVVTSARTYSAGFDAVLLLRSQGAKIVGVPSAQAANCFIDGLEFELPRSKLGGTVSFKRSLRLPTEPEKGELLRPDVELTYDASSKRAFDPNAVFDLVGSR